MKDYYKVVVGDKWVECKKALPRQTFQQDILSQPEEEEETNYIQTMMNFGKPQEFQMYQEGSAQKVDDWSLEEEVIGQVKQEEEQDEQLEDIEDIFNGVNTIQVVKRPPSPHFKDDEDEEEEEKMDQNKENLHPNRSLRKVKPSGKSVLKALLSQVQINKEEEVQVDALNDPRRIPLDSNILSKKPSIKSNSC